MGVQTFDNANKVAKAIKEIIDDYWKNEISSEEARKRIEKILMVSDNRVRAIRGDSYTGVFKNIMGKRRLEEFERLFRK